MKRILTVLLCLCLVASAVLGTVACDKKHGDDTTAATETPPAPTPENDDLGYPVLTSFVEGEYLARNGESGYTVLLPENADENLTLASEELVALIKEATGATLAVRRDSEAGDLSASARLLSLGDNKASRAAGVQADASLGAQGFILRTVGNSIYLCGTDSLGTLYAAYEFLFQTLHFETFSPDYYYIEKTSELRVPVLSCSDAPAIQYRLNGYGAFIATSAAARSAVRMRITDSPIVGVGPGYVYNTHNTSRYFTEQQKNDNPKWFGTDGYQLCYTARGDKESLEKMQDAVLEVMKDAFLHNPTKETVAFMQEDYNTWCACEECTRVIAAHGGFCSSTQTLFVNAVAKKLKAWNREVCPERDLKIVVFAYHKTTAAPVRWDEATSSYVPYSDDMVVKDNVAVYYAPITASYFDSFTDGKNRPYYNVMLGWNAVCKNLYMWVYSTDFRNYMMFYDSFGSMVENYRFMQSHNTVMVFENTQYDNANSTAFHILKAYLNAKIQWNADQDYDTLIRRFFVRYFGPAADEMRRIYDEQRMNYAENYYYGSVTGDTAEDLDRATLQPYAMLVGQLALIERAYERIASLKDTDPTAYEFYASHILLESLSPRYCLIALYSGRFQNTELLRMKQQFKKDCYSLGMSKYCEGGALASLFSSWGV